MVVMWYFIDFSKINFILMDCGIENWWSDEIDWKGNFWEGWWYVIYVVVKG